MTVFRSESANLRVTFPPEQFGMGDGVEEVFDDNGDIRQKRMPFKSAKFQLGLYETDNHLEIKRLRGHVSFKAMFWEEKEADTTAIAAFTMERGAKAPPEGVTSDDRGRLLVMADVSSKTLSPDKKGWAIEEINWANSRFRVTGYLAPTEERKPKVVRAGLVTLLDILDESGITDEPRAGNIESSPGLDG